MIQTPQRDVARMSEYALSGEFNARAEERRVKEIKSSKNNERIRELSKQLTSSTGSQERKEKELKKVTTVGARIQKKGSKSETPAALKAQKKGMLAFDVDSDSDQLYRV